MQSLQSLVTTCALGFSPHIECNACLDLLLGAYTVDTLLHLPVAPIATLHRIRGRGEQCVIEKRQSFLEGRRKEFLQRLTQMLEPVQATPQIGQLVEGGLRATPSVEQPVDLLHDLAQLAELGETTGDPPQPLACALAQGMPDQQVPMREQIGALLFQALFLAGGLLGRLRARTTPG